MISIFAMALLAFALAACAAARAGWIGPRLWPHAVSGRLDLATLIFPALYVPLLLIATRFGARTFPGIWVPNHPFLNDIAQGGIFYIAAVTALLCGGIEILVTTTAASHGALKLALLWTKRVLLTGVVAVCLYGFIAAIELGRLP